MSELHLEFFVGAVMLIWVDVFGTATPILNSRALGFRHDAHAAESDRLHIQAPRTVD